MDRRGRRLSVLGALVAIYRLLQNSAFEAEHMLRMMMAYEFALIELQLKDRNDPLTCIVAHSIIEAAQTGVKDEHRLCAMALSRLRGTERQAS